MLEEPTIWIMNPIMLPNLHHVDVVCRYTCLSCLKGEKPCKRDFTWVISG